MDDPHRKPGDQDRSALEARIRRAAADGRISEADRDIRLRNVASAQSVSELDLIGRDLDQLESALPSAPAPATAPSTTPWTGPWTGPAAATVADELADKAVDTARSTARSIGLVTLVIILVVGIGAIGVTAFSAIRGSSSSDDPGGGLKDPVPLTASPPAPDPTDGGSGGSAQPPGPAYSLSSAGIRAFLAAYEHKFHTTEVIDLVMYGDYVVVNVPVAGKARHSGWLYRTGQGWSTFGGVTANFPGARPVDTKRLAVAPLLRNVARARRSLAVEDPSTTYVIVRHYTSSDDVPSVDIHVANEYNESGYLATTLDGTVERAYPYSAQ